MVECFVLRASFFSTYMELKSPYINNYPIKMARLLSFFVYYNEYFACSTTSFTKEKKNNEESF